MKNLGKVLLLFIFLTTTLYGGVIASVEPKEVYKGDSATYMLTITGSKVKKPTLLDICGNEITATSSQTSIESINGNYQKSYVLSYSFTPTQNCTIKSISMEIDSQMEHSNSVNLVVKPRAQNVNAEFVLSLESSKNELYVGEPFTITLLLKQNKSAQAVDSKFNAPAFSGFWIKSEGKPQRYEDGDKIVTKINYTLAAQRSGELSIEPAQLRIAKRVGRNNWGAFMPQVKWQTYYSNSIKIKSKTLPNNVKIIGDFKINAEVDKSTINPNEAVNLTLTVQGIGNLEDIESFKPYVSGVNVFDEKINIVNNTLTQKLVFVGDKDYVIPAFELAYFDTRTQSVRKIFTKEISVRVSGSGVQKELQITRADEVVPTPHPQKIQKVVEVKENYLAIGFAFLMGILITVIFMLFKPSRSKKHHRKFDSKNEKLLLVKLLPFKETDEEVAAMITLLENNIYAKVKEKLDKKLLKKILQKYNIF